MIKISNFKKETRYGVPAADQILFNRHYVLGYSYFFRQAKWTLEIVDTGTSEVVRKNNFRPDYRVPECFRADLANYKNSKYDRGHLVSSSNQIETEIQNSETFLLSNMCPQQPKFNSGVWKKLEVAIRKKAMNSKTLETYIITGPIFFFDKEVKMMPSIKSNGVTLPIPHAYFKSILTESNTGALKMWSFIIPNKHTLKSLEEFQVKTSKIEKYSGLFLWEALVGRKYKLEKDKIRRLWKF